MNVSPDKWGNHTWKMMHYITYSYPDNPAPDNKRQVYDFFVSLQNLLPCEKCRVNYKIHLQEYPLTASILQDKRKLINWLIDIHNQVNRSLNKPVITYAQADKIYLDNQKSYMTMRIFCIIMCIVFMVSFKYYHTLLTAH
jgi:hypothetical protein